MVNKFRCPVCYSTSFRFFNDDNGESRVQCQEDVNSANGCTFSAPMNLISRQSMMPPPVKALVEQRAA